VRRRIAVATADTLGEQMAGPAMRAWHIAEELAKEHDVRLTSTVGCTVTHPTFSTSHGDDSAIAELVEWCDVFIFQGWVQMHHPVIARSDKVVVADVYDPMHLEQLVQGQEKGQPRWDDLVKASSATLNDQLGRADFVICASEEQRSFWLGQLAAIGRVNPAIFDLDHTYRSFIDVVPFGLSDEPPVPTAPAMRGVIDGVGPDDLIVLWNGGVYNWFDPVTLLRAVALLRDDLPNVRLVFMGMRHPNPDVPEMRVAAETMALADELGLTGRHVFFNTDWVPFDQRQNFLLEADLAVSTHLPGLETDFAFRTRILDCLWAGLPVVVTEGGALSELVADRWLGAVVPASDPEALADAIRQLATDPAHASGARARMVSVSEEFRWSRVLEPLVRFCRDPHRAADLLDARTAADWRYDLGTGWVIRNRWLRKVVRLLYLVDQEGIVETLRRQLRRRGPAPR
jgi:glycosyltransferase involved in cell wall biosynthesis